MKGSSASTNAVKLRNGRFTPVARGLPPACRWLESSTDDGSAFLHYHFGSIAAAHRDGRFSVRGWGQRPPVEGKAASFQQAKRFVTRLVEVRGIPWKPRSRGHYVHDPALLDQILRFGSVGRPIAP